MQPEPESGISRQLLNIWANEVAHTESFLLKLELHKAAANVTQQGKRAD